MIPGHFDSHSVMSEGEAAKLAACGKLSTAPSHRRYEFAAAIESARRLAWLTWATMEVFVGS